MEAMAEEARMMEPFFCYPTGWAGTTN